MALPKIERPLYEIKLPSNGKCIHFTPFSVKEEKILLTAQQSKDTEQVLTAIRQMINNCVIDYDVDDMAIFDLEYVMLNIRSKSVNNEVQFKIVDPDTKEEVTLEMNIDDVKIHRVPEHTNKIKIDDTYTLFLRYPTIENYKNIIKIKDMKQEDAFDVMISSIDKLASEEEVYEFKDFTKNQIDEFADSLPGFVFTQITEFFDTMPKVRHEIKYVNSAGTEKTFTIQGTQSFFI